MGDYSAAISIDKLGTERVEPKMRPLDLEGIM